MDTTIKTKLFRHYKNKYYKILGEAHHSETMEKLVLYETRYNSDLGPLWVRPKEMFFGNIEHQGTFQPRFENIEFQVHYTQCLSTEDKHNITQLLTNIFDDFDSQKMFEKLKKKNNPLLISLFDKERFVGFKLGYEHNKQTFYSWLGAVDSDYQKGGLGHKLMSLQHQWAQEKGYERVQTKTMNKWQTMLLLNIRHGFQIIATEKTTNGEIKILMEKEII